ncbi:MAG TPA: hypothetical protein VMH86_15715 [Rhizomicrobium sp.]|nr:hypothetical protein [Rhizomicrobium sp.]
MPARAAPVLPAAALAAMLFAVPARADVSHCIFRLGDDGYSGSCGPMWDENPVFALKQAPAVTTGTWREDVKPMTVWRGTMTDSDGTSAVTLELYAGGRGIFRTAYGWFGAADFTAGREIAFDLDAAREVMPGALDRRIIARAAAILSSEDAWNREDNRVCPAGATAWSIYCAMQKATVELTGAADHRRPAMEAVRAVIDDRSAGRDYNHRLMDYNNDMTTTLSDVKGVFRDALAGIGDPRWLARHGFAPSPPF